MREVRSSGSPRRRARFVILTLALGCTGSIDGAAGPDPSSPPPTSPGSPAPMGAGGTTDNGTIPTPSDKGMLPMPTAPMSNCDPNAFRPGVSPLRRLTRFEYNQTVADLLGDSTAPGKRFPVEEKLLGFDNNATSDVSIASSALVAAYETAAEELARKAVENLPALMGCAAAQTGEDACARTFISSFGLRAYRRPLTKEEQDKAFAFFSAQKVKHGPQVAAQMFVQATLQSPHFLYRIEGGEAGMGVVKASPHELATRLSYLLWSSMPDKALFDAAASGELGTAAGVAKQARRMVADAKARRAVESFFGQWLDTEHVLSTAKDAATYPKWNANIAALMRTETDTFVAEVVLRGAGTLTELLRGSFSYMNRELAGFYGVSGPTGTAFEKVTLSATQRAGILTQGSFLAGHSASRQSSPVARGFYLRDRLFCAPPPPPPANVVAQIKEPDGNSTTRERFEQHRADPACAGCHALMDPLGLGFENYDGIGIWRTMDGGRMVDARGEIINTQDLNGTFTGAIELTTKLAGSAQVRDCMVRQIFRYAFARGETEADQCTLASLGAALTGANGNIRELMVALTQTDPFLFRTTGGAP